MALGERLGQKAKEGTLFCLFGDLGAGKTTLIKGIAKGLGINPEEVFSPTFLYLAQYVSDKGNLFNHFDLYRLHNVEEFLSLGFEEYFFGKAITCVEWSEKIENVLPEDRISLHLSAIGEGQDREKRKVVIEYHGKNSV